MANHTHPMSDATHARGPLSFLHPTTRYHPVISPQKQQQHKHPEPTSQAPSEPPLSREGRRESATPETTTPETTTPETTTPEDHGARQVYHVWRSRDNRKGRRRAVITGPKGPQSRRVGLVDEEKTQLKKTVRGVSRLFTRFPVWDVTYLVAVSFVLAVHLTTTPPYPLGSIIWCINGCFVWLPIVAPSSEFEGETAVAAGILAFIGATVFEVGSVLMVVEAINAEQSDCFGWALEESLEDHGLRLHPKHEGCRHAHRSRRSLLKDSAVATMAADAVENVAEPGGLEGRKDGDGETRTEKERKWSWWPTWQEFRTHYIKEIGFLACAVQLLGASIFWISGFTALPPIYDALSVPVMNGVYWVPQVVGGTGFIVSGLMFMVEVQDKWYKPAPKMLGWQIGFWNLLGGIGFTN
ncbi:hypothetical protein NEMBOFW57_004927 [Staphylotrichum longicolle]|uniref:Integral membrane protein n=1 Tax=Staphylotrichum longicolle TaxID=669026 RepID=A0AAD4HVN1_9PEZI|nr:hypothetical protein NEMBOFW57_004927 [Staphylotrichum longicolle]